MLIATVGAKGSCPGCRVTFDDGVFEIESVGSVSAADLLEMEAADGLVWVSDPTREWFYAFVQPTQRVAQESSAPLSTGTRVAFGVLAVAVIAAAALGFAGGKSSGQKLGYSRGFDAGVKKGTAQGERLGRSEGLKSAEAMNDAMFDIYDFVYFPFTLKSGGTYVVKVGKTDKSDSPAVQKVGMKAIWCSKEAGDGRLSLVYVPYGIESGNWYAMKIKRSSKGDDDLPGVLGEFEAVQCSNALDENHRYSIDGDGFYSSKLPTYSDY